MAFDSHVQHLLFAIISFIYALFFLCVRYLDFFFQFDCQPKSSTKWFGVRSISIGVSNSFCFSVEKFTGHQHCTEFKWIIGRVIKLLLVCCLFCFDLPNRIHSDELVQFAVRMTRERERAYLSNKCWFCHLVQFTMLKSSIHNYTTK